MRILTKWSGFFFNSITLHFWRFLPNAQGRTNIASLWRLFPDLHDNNLHWLRIRYQGAWSLIGEYCEGPGVADWFKKSTITTRSLYSFILFKSACSLEGSLFLDCFFEKIWIHTAVVSGLNIHSLFIIAPILGRTAEFLWRITQNLNWFLLFPRSWWRITLRILIWTD